MDALVGDHQRARLSLVEHGQRAEVTPEGLVAEAASFEVQQHAVLAVVEGQVGELVRVRVWDPWRGSGGCRTRHSARPTRRRRQTPAASRLPRCWCWLATADHVRRGRCARPADRGPSEAARGEERRARGSPRSPAPVSISAPTTAPSSRTSRRGRERTRSSPLTHEALASQQVVGHVRGAAAAVSQDRPGLPTWTSRDRIQSSASLQCSTTRRVSSGSASGFTSRMTSTVGAVHMNPA
jgi:hypothetical protein